MSGRKPLTPEEHLLAIEKRVRIARWVQSLSFGCWLYAAIAGWLPNPFLTPSLAAFFYTLGVTRTRRYADVLYRFTRESWRIAAAQEFKRGYQRGYVDTTKAEQMAREYRKRADEHAAQRAADEERIQARIVRPALPPAPIAPLPPKKEG